MCIYIYIIYIYKIYYIYILYIYIYIYYILYICNPNLPRNVISRLSHRRRGDTK